MSLQWSAADAIGCVHLAVCKGQDAEGTDERGDEMHPVDMWSFGRV
jgi:hypothetical protein